jgi:hypothetical protein
LFGDEYMSNDGWFYVDLKILNYEIAMSAHIPWFGSGESNRPRANVNPIIISYLIVIYLIPRSSLITFEISYDPFLSPLLNPLEGPTM